MKYVISGWMAGTGIGAYIAWILLPHSDAQEVTYLAAAGIFFIGAILAVRGK